jgi:transposase InsO family protein
MSYFSAITAADRICFEGNEVTKIVPLKDRSSGGMVTHYQLSVCHPEQGAVLRKFSVDEIPHLLESEILIVDKGFHSLARQTDRALYGTDELFGAKKKQRKRVDRITFLCRRMGHYCKLGMPLTPEGVEVRRSQLVTDYNNYQANSEYQTQKSNTTQTLNPLPANTTLLDYYRRYRKGGHNPKVFIPQRPGPIDIDHQEAIDRHYILTILSQYASGTNIAKRDVAEKAVEGVEEENDRRRSLGFSALIKVKSARTYERWIDVFLDPFTVVLQREGLPTAKAKFGSVEGGMKARNIGEQVILDAWKLHVVTLDATRDQLNRMTPEQRAKVPRVRRWVIVAIDMATRVILGFAFCRAPNGEASLRALRLCFADKTFLLEEAGLLKSSWKHRTPIHLVSTDSGSEFGKHPFGGALFGEAVRRLTGSFLNSVTGVPELRGTIERLFLTFELKWARHLPGWTAGSVSQLNDRKPYFEACISDDELQNLFVKFVADYNTSPHRGLNMGTPAGAWDKLSKDPLFDLTMLPGPAALREACGKYETAGVSEAGIRFKGLTYSNEFIRDQRMAKGVDRIAQPGEKLEIKMDPMDMGAISVLADGDLIAVPCLDDTMRGKSLAWWTGEQERRKAETLQDAESRAPARDEARKAWMGESAAIARSAGVNPHGRTSDEIDRLARAVTSGKGRHEKPFIGRDEYVDPITSGNKIGVEVENEKLDTSSAFDDEVNVSRTNPLDRFRSKGNRTSNSKYKRGDS